MIAKTLNYTDFNDEQAQEIAYFNINKNESSLLFLEYGNNKNALTNYIQRIAEDNDLKGYMLFIDKIVEIAYGVKSDDGRRIDKDEKRTKLFMSSPAYDVLLDELTSSPQALLEFILGALSTLSKDQKQEARKEINSAIAELESKEQ